MVVRLVQLWRAADLSLVGVLRGHKRGVWAVEFSPVDKCVASASGDQTVRLWSVVDFSCIRTLEGHTSSVLCVRFLRQGTQLVSTAADGIVKLWTVKDSEVRVCVCVCVCVNRIVWDLVLSSRFQCVIVHVNTASPRFDTSD